jgi:thioredoxin-like negative regulator of GroEL
MQPGNPRPIPGWIPSTPAVTPACFDGLIAEQPAVAIHFWAPWNASDPTLDRSIQAIAPEFVERVCFRSCNVDLPENQDLCERCGVANVPFLAVFVRGQQRRPISGARSPAQLAKELTARLSLDIPTRPWWRFWGSSE